MVMTERRGTDPGRGEGPSSARAVVFVLLGVIASALALYLFSGGREQTERTLPIPPPVRQAPPVAQAPQPVPPEESASQPAPQAAGEPPLPALDDSDEAVTAALEALFAPRDIAGLLRPGQILRKAVITVDNLPDRRLPVKYLPLRPPQGPFRVRRAGGRIFLDPANQARYAPYVALLEAVDVDAARDFLRRFGPLLQSAYEELGYPEARFEDRLLAVIDQLLDTPEVRGPIELVQPSVFYKYADPELESLAWGQRLLLRMGPDNARAVKDWLRRFRAALRP